MTRIRPRCSSASWSVLSLHRGRGRVRIVRESLLEGFELPADQVESPLDGEVDPEAQPVNGSAATRQNPHPLVTWDYRTDTRS